MTEEKPVRDPDRPFQKGPCSDCPYWTTPVPKENITEHNYFRAEPEDSGWCGDRGHITRGLNGCDDRSGEEVLAWLNEKMAENKAKSDGHITSRKQEFEALMEARP